MALPPAILPPRYRDVAPIGEGAFGLVYRATDEANRQVAVKVLAPAQATRPEALWQLGDEFRRLSRLSHPAFPAAYEEGRTPDGRPFFSMALVDGQAPRGPLPAAEVRRLVGALADALAYVHGLGWTYGDLKPENLRLDGERVHVLDLGLMAPTGERREAIAGTFEYMAPELLRKAPVAPAADLYALGCVAYELWTGQPPFHGNVAQLVRAQLTSTPATLVGRVPDLDEALADLVMALLRKDPAARPTAAAVLRALGLECPYPEAGAALDVGSFVGRQHLLAAWQATLDGTADATWTVTGGEGLGKSRTLDEARLLAQLAGLGWAGAACGGAADAPGSPVRAVVRQALGLAGRTASPLLAAWLAGETPAELADLEPGNRQAALQAAVAEALGEAARKLGGLAIGLDDFHAADGATLELVSVLQRTLADVPVRFALATADAANSPQALAPLTEAEARQLLASRLGAEPPTALVERVLPAAGGSPLWLHAMLEHLVASGQLRRDGSGWAYHEAADRRDAAGGLQALWAARRDALGPAERRLATLLAVAAGAGELPTATLARVAGFSEVDVATAAEGLAAAGLAMANAGRLKLAIPAMAEALLVDERAEQRAGVATQLAAALAEAPFDALPMDRLAQAAWLAAAGTDDRLAWQLAAEAGRRSLGLPAAQDAIRFLREAARRMPADAPAATRLGVLLPKAEAERLLDLLDDAREDYEAALPLAASLDDAPAEIRARYGLAKCHQLKASYPLAFEQLEAASARAATTGEVALQGRVDIALARLCMYRGDNARAIETCQEAVKRLMGAGAPAMLAQALNILGVLLAQADATRADEGLGLLREAVALGTAVGDRQGVVTSYEGLGNLYLMRGDLAEATEAFEAAAGTAHAIGGAGAELEAHLNQALAASERGEDVEALAADVTRRSRALGRKFMIAASLTAEAQVGWRKARFDRAFEHLDEALAVATEIKNQYLEEHVRLYRLEAALAAGRPALAREELLLASALVDVTQHADARARLAVWDGELALLEGRADEAREALTHSLKARHRVAAHRARQLLAGLALATGDAQASRDHARAALALATPWRAPWHEAQDHWLIARAEAALGSAAMTSHAESAAAGPNPFAAAGAGLMLGDPAPAAALLETLAPLGTEARLEVLGAWGLESALARPKAVATGAVSADGLSRAMTRLARAQGEEAIARALLDATMTLAKAERGYVLAYEDGSLRRAVTRGIDYEAELAGGFSSTLAEEVLFTGQPLYVLDAGADARWQQAASVMALGLRTVIGLPLAVPAELLGVVYLDRSTPEPVLAEADITLLTTLATAAAALIVREREQRSAQLRAAGAEAALALIRELAAPGADIPARLLAAALKTAPAQRAFWLVPAADGWQVAAAHTRDGSAPGLERAPISRGIADWVAERGEPLGILDPGASEQWQARMSVQALGLRTVWCLPTGTPDGALLYVDTDEPGLDPTAPLAALEALVAPARPFLTSERV